MKHFVTSNFNLMHSNNEWKDIKDKQKSQLIVILIIYFFN